MVSEVHGTWGKAKQVPGIAALNTGGGAQLFSVSCASPGNCSAGGEYNDSSDRGQAFVASQTNGTWGTAKEVPGTGALNTGGGAGVNGAYVTSVSCASAGTCSAGGQYKACSGHVQQFVANKVNGTWGTAKELPGTAALNTGGFAEIMSVSCAPAGTCSAGGFYAGTGGLQAFVVNKA